MPEQAYSVNYIHAFVFQNLKQHSNLLKCLSVLFDTCRFGLLTLLMWLKHDEYFPLLWPY